jgi:Abnormal spindle-like microcephaly-assoc'd, ASPM-SPD-2-Hydin
MKQTLMYFWAIGLGLSFFARLDSSPRADKNIGSASVALPATGLPTAPAAAPAVSLSPTSINFPNQQVGTTSPGQPVTVTNTGNATLTFTRIAILGTSAKDFVSTTTTCKTNLAAGASCVITVVFTPTQTGTRSKTLTFADNASNSPQTVALTGVGIAASVTLTPSTFPNNGGSSLSFGQTAVGSTSAPESITLNNPGNAALSISNIAINGDFAQTNTCGTSVSAGSSCTISVTFSPTQIWSRSGSVIISDNAFGSPQQVILLVGMGGGSAKASLSPTSLTFATQALGTTSASQPITLSNTGATALTINSIVATGDFAQTNNCGASLAIGKNCTINVSFSPSYPAAAARKGYITVNDTDPTFLQTVTLTGQAATVSNKVVVNPGFGSLTSKQTQQFSATVSGSSSPAVTWSVDGIIGGNSTVGTISPTGLYTPPSTAGWHTIQATNVANPAQVGLARFAVTNYSGTLTYKNDNLHSGQNLNETVLTSGNVNAVQFGKLFSYSVDGYVFAQPLYAPAVNIPSQGVHNVVYVATENDSVYAFDADNLVSQPLWQTSFISPASGITTVPAQDVQSGYFDIPVQIGITATPVIDPTISTIFVLARTKETVNGEAEYVQRLHALNMTTGAEQAGSPVVIEGTVDGTGVGGNGSQVEFDPLRENPRTGLLIVNGSVYAAWASMDDIQPWHGWIVGYSESALQQVSLFNTTPNGNAGGIWGAGGALTADTNGNIYTTTGNGTFDAGSGGVDYGDTVLKLTGAGGSLAVNDYFTPFNQAALTSVDWDLGSGGMILLPDQPGTFPHLIMAGGKGSTIYEINRDDMGEFNQTSNQIVLTVPAVIGAAKEINGNRAGGPGYWQGQLYYAGAAISPMQFSLLNGLISSIPIVERTNTFGYPGASLVVSSNGNTNGIVWALQTDGYTNNSPAVLHAYDAANISRELWNTNQLQSQNVAGPAVKFTVPTVANGKVYVGTQTQLNVYGLLP